MVASLYPSPLGRRRGARARPGLRDIADRRTQKLSGGQTQRVRFAVALVSDPELLVLDEPTVAMDVEARHAFWTTMRDFAARGKTVLFATHYLEEADAYADRAVLMAHGSSSPTARPTEIKATRRHAHDPRDAARTPPSSELGLLPGVTHARAPRRRGRARAAPTPTPRSARCSPRYPEARDIEITGAGLEEAFLRADRRRGRPRHEPLRLHPLRAAADAPQPALLLFSLGFPLILYFLIAAPNTGTTRTSTAPGLSAPLYYMVGLAAFGTMNAMISSGARIAGERSVGWTRQLRITPLSHARRTSARRSSPRYTMARLTLSRSTCAGSSLGVTPARGAMARG